MPTLELEKTNIITPEFASNGNAKEFWYDFDGIDPNHMIIVPEGVRLNAPLNGATTEGSNRTRTEFREIVPGTTDRHNWKYSDYVSQALRGAFKTERTTARARFAFAQIHMIGSSKPPLKMIWDQGKIIAEFRPTAEQEDPFKQTILTDAQLFDRINFSVSTAYNGNLSINLSKNNVLANPLSFSFGPSYANEELYFKIGVYNQEDQNPLYTNGEGTTCLFDKIQFYRP